VKLKIIASSVHMLQQKKSVRDRRIGFMRLERIYRHYRSYNTKIILCDKNAKVGKEIWTGIAVGTWDIHDESLDRCGKSRPHRDSIPRPSSL
jgi:hypothetical protein